MKLKRGDLICVKWIDSVGCPRGWELLDDARSTDCSVIESIGWVVKHDKQAVQIAPHVSSVNGKQGGVMGHMTIPLVSVLTFSSVCLSPA